VNNKEVLDQIFYPFAAILSVKVWAAVFLLSSVGWLVASRALRIGLFPSLSTTLWWVIIGLACASVVLSAALFFLAPYGPDGYRVVFTLFVVAPLVVASAIIWFCKPV
jgi:hypothetical protein